MNESLKQFILYTAPNGEVRVDVSIFNPNRVSNPVRVKI
jgi:hypothetical protein